MICYILDDQYGKKIYEWMKDQIDAIFPIQDNIKNPLDYIDEIIQSKVDYVLLDNYFPNRTSGWEEALGNEFLISIMNKKKDTKIICISDYWERLINEYDGRSQAYKSWLVTKFIASKNAKDIINAL